MDGTIQAIIELWNQAHNVKYIAMKLGLYDEVGELDIEKVEIVIDDPTNYKSRKEYQRRQYA